MNTCTDTMAFGDRTVRCELEAGHDTPDEFGGTEGHYADDPDTPGYGYGWGVLRSDKGEPSPPPLKLVR